jgi:hypothetical protein
MEVQMTDDTRGVEPNRFTAEQLANLPFPLRGERYPRTIKEYLLSILDVFWGLPPHQFNMNDPLELGIRNWREPIWATFISSGAAEGYVEWGRLPEVDCLYPFVKGYNAAQVNQCMRLILKETIR